MPTRDAADTVDLLARRADVLALLRGGEQTKRALVESHSASRSTVDRAVRDLESRGFVTRSDGSVAITLQGRLALSVFEDAAAAVESLDAAGPVLEPLDATATIDVALLRGADVLRADSVTPNRPVVELASLLDEATAVCGFARGVLPSHVEAYYDRVVNHGTTVRFVVTDEVLDEVVASYDDMLAAALDTGRFEVMRATRSLEYDLLLVEKTDRTVVSAIVYGDRGVAGVVSNDDERAVDWAASTLEDLRDAAEPVSL